MKITKRMISVLLASVMVLAMLPISALTAFADGGYTVTLYANDGQGTQEQIENVSGLYVLPECDFTPPPEKTFLAWAIGSQSGEQKQPGAAINVTSDTLIVAIWTESAAIYETRPNGGVTAVNGTFDIRYRLTLQPDTLFLEFYNDYQGKWAEKFTLATMPEHEGALTHFSVPTIHKDTEETVKFRLCAGKDGVNYYSNEFVVKYTNNRFTLQPEDAMLFPGTEYNVTYAMNFTPSAVTVECKDGNAWKHYSNADVDGVSISGGDGERAEKFRIKAVVNGEAYYSREFAVRWATVTEVGTFNELLNAVNSDKTYIKLTRNIQDVVPDDELPTRHRLIFDGGRDYVLDLDGYTLEIINHINEYYTAEFPMISVSGGSSLEIRDGSLVFDNYYAKNDRKARGVVHVADTSTLVATHVDMRNKYSGNVVSATADTTVTLNGGEYAVQNGFALYLDRQASLTLDGDIFIHTMVGDSANTQYVDGYGALYSESTGKLEVNSAYFKSGIQVHKTQIGAFSTADHEVTINGKVLTEDIFVGTSTEAKNRNKEYFWYSYNQNALERVQDNSFCNTVRVISYDKKYPIEVENGTAMVNGTPVTEASYGQTVTIVADTPEAGMEFIRWDTSGAALADHFSASTTFPMLPAPVYLAAYYGRETVKSVALTVDVPTVGQKMSDMRVVVEGGVTVGLVEWYEDHVVMDKSAIFLPGKTYEIRALVYPPNENKFDESISATVNGKSATISANAQYAYIDFVVTTTEAPAFSVVYNTTTAQLGVGGRLELDTDLMAAQSALFKEAYDGGSVAYQWYKDGEIVEWAITPAYYFEAEDVGSTFYVTVTIGDKTAWGHTVHVGNHLYQIYLNASEIIPGGKAPQMSSGTPGIGIDPESLLITEGYGMPALDIQKTVLIPGKSYVVIGSLVATGEANVPDGANVHINGELMPEATDGIGQFYYEFEVPEGDYSVYYQANGEIGIGVTLTVDVEKMCQESGTFKNAYHAANPTYQTVFYQWYKNGEKISGATKESYTVKTTDRDSMINCVVSLVDGKCGIGEQFEISNVITVLNITMPRPKDGQTRIEKSDIMADGVTVVGIMWWPAETGAEMQGEDTYVEGTVYEFYLQVQAKDTFLLDFNGDMTIAYIYGAEAIVGGSVPNQGKAFYLGEVTAIHAHRYSDTVWDSDTDGHWKPCIVPGCPDPNEEWEGYVPHYGGNATCHTSGVCSVCGATYYEEHDFSIPIYVYKDDMICVGICNYEGCDATSDWNYHTGGVYDCMHKSVCEICHHEYGDFGDHVPKTEWVTDDESHWHECGVCGGQQLEKVAHEDGDGDGTCDVCGYEWLEADTAPADTDTETTEPACTDIDTEPTETDTQGTEEVTTTADEDTPPKKGKGAIVGVIVSGAAALGAGGFAVYWFGIKKKTFADLLRTGKKQ